MMRFFWTILLPMGATGACAAVLLWLTRPLLHRMGQAQWPAAAVIAALCLFVVPVYLFAPRLPAAEMPVPVPAQAQNNAGTGVASPPASPSSGNASLFPAGTSPSSAAAASSAAADTSSADAEEGAANMPGPGLAGDRGFAAGMSAIVLRVLPLIWAAGAVLALLCSAVSYVRFAVRLRRSSRAVTDAAALDSLRAAQKKSGAARMPELRCTEAIASPLAMGIVRPCIYLPANVPADASLDYALQHECVHLRKGHLFWKLAAQLVCALHWFDPAVWLLARLLNEACEFDCDRAVAAALDSRQRQGYCAALLNAADRGRVPRCVSAFASPAIILRRRIEAVLAPKARQSKRIASAVLCAALVFCASGLTACAAGQAAGSAAGMLPAPQADDSSWEDQPQQDDPLQQGDPEQADGLLSAPVNDTQLLQSGVFRNEPDETAAEWVWPVPGVKYLTTMFTEDIHPGMDICASQYEAILAVKDGTVSIAEFDHGYGNYIEIDHGDGWKSLYAHCSMLLVQPGDTVSAGQVIACVGCTGMSTGYHCHLELLQDETPVDPLTLFATQINNPGFSAQALPNVMPQRPNISFHWYNSRESADAFSVAGKILGEDASDEERIQFEQNARFWQASFHKPVTVLNQPKGEAYITLFLCEYEENIYICDVLECGFTEGDGWKRISDIFVNVTNSRDTQVPSEVTIGANFLNGNETDSTLIASTFVPVASEE